MMDEQHKIVKMGGTMRLGAHKIVIKEDTKLFNAYNKKEIRERFRIDFILMKITYI